MKLKAQKLFKSKKLSKLEKKLLKSKNLSKNGIKNIGLNFLSFIFKIIFNFL